MPSTNHQTTTSAITLQPIGSVDSPLFQICAGIPAERALCEAGIYLDSAREILKLLEDESAVVCGVIQLINAASGIVDSVSDGMMGDAGNDSNSHARTSGRRECDVC